MTFSQLSAQKVSWSIGDTRIVDNISHAFRAGAVTGLLGPNGSGKSSLVRLLSGLNSPASGLVELDGRSIGSLGSRQRARTMAVMDQHPGTSQPTSVRQAVALGRIPHRSLLGGEHVVDRQIVGSVLSALDLTDFADRDLDTLSGGERQRVHIARALVQQPRVLLVDEPTNHLDIKAQFDILAILRQVATQAGSDNFSGTEAPTVVVALHDLNLAARYCDQLILLCEGRVVAAGKVQEVLTPANIRKVYGVDAAVMSHPVTGEFMVALAPLTHSAQTDQAHPVSQQRAATRGSEAAHSASVPAR